MLDFITVNTHSSIRIDAGKIIYIDPFKITESRNDADIILITHDHFDHYSPEDIRKVMKSDTVVVCPESVDKSGETGLEVKQISTDDKFEIKGIKIETIPAYNKLKSFHPKSKGWVGYIIDTPGHGRIYIAGDTDITKENSQVKCDIAMLPVGGKYTMDSKEAAQLTDTIHPKYAVPIHYGSITGSPEDGEAFIKALTSDVQAVIKIS